MSGLWADEVYGPVAVALYKRCGLVFEGGQAHLFRKRLERRAEELGHESVVDYVAALERGREGELDFLVDLLTVNETYFFREEEHFHVVLDHLWPEWMRAGERPIRIWSAGSSTGCEAYTLAILLREKGLNGPGRVEAEVVGTDVNSRVLNDARAGLYGDFALRGVASYYRKKYFRTEAHLLRLEPSIREMVTFRRFNLLKPDNFAAAERFHAIFCRNVLIYFDLEAKRKAVGTLARSLRPGGVLIVGRSESLFNIPEAPPLANVGGTLVHRKTR